MTGLGKGAFGVLAALGLVSGLAGCGGGTGTGTTAALPTRSSDPQAYYDQVLSPNFKTQQTYLNGNSASGQAALPNTSYVGMPTSGTATYNGYALLYANTRGTVAGVAKLGIVGTAQLNANFGTSSMTGTLTNFVGSEVTANSTGGYDFSKTPTAYNGSLTMTDGCIGNAAGCPGVTRPNQFTGTFKGALTGQGHTVATDATILGDFRGTPIKGVYATGTSGPIQVDATAVNGDLTIMGEK